MIKFINQSQISRHVEITSACLSNQRILTVSIWHATLLHSKYVLSKIIFNKCYISTTLWGLELFWYRIKKKIIKSLVLATAPTSEIWMFPQFLSSLCYAFSLQFSWKVDLCSSHNCYANGAPLPLRNHFANLRMQSSVSTLSHTGAE